MPLNYSEDIDILVISRGGITMHEWIFENQNGENVIEGKTMASLLRGLKE